MEKTSRLLLALVALIGFSAGVHALEFMAGEYYFDNSKLHFNNVKMVLGNDTITHIYEMLPYEQHPSWLRAVVTDDINDLNGFCFIDSGKESGTYNQGLQDFLNECDSTQVGFRHTKVRESISTRPSRIVDWVFCPLNDAPHSDGYWRPKDSYSVEPSRTIPLIFINTQDSAPIVTKDYYINGKLWIDNCNTAGFESLASEGAPLDIEIKGRGNVTWLAFYKKPYKIKFSGKVSPLGLDRSKHFILVPRAQDYDGYVRNTTGFELSRLLEMSYTTSEVPVELVLNGEYQGLYFFGENIRVESGRVEIIEQNEYETDPYLITGGWLLENRGYENPIHQQFENNDPTKNHYAFESKSPEHYSQEQQNYISTFISQADSCIFVDDKTDTGWEQYLDISSIAKFYVIQEVLENVEAFTASLFMYKDIGENEKFHFGPVWDFDSSYFNSKLVQHTTADNFIFNYDTGFAAMWIEELCKFPHFQQEIKKVWKQFKNTKCLEKLVTHIFEFKNFFKTAQVKDLQRWPTYASSHMPEDTEMYIQRLTEKVAWLDEQWSVPVGDVNCDGHVNSVDVTVLYSYLLGDDDSSSYRYTCDVDGDGHISSVDITAIYNILLNGFPPLPHHH